MNIQKFLYNFFIYEPQKDYDFSIPSLQNNVSINSNINQDINVSENLRDNLNFIKVKYNTLINNDIKLKEFKINFYNETLSALLVYIDGMVDDEQINFSVLQPLMLKNSMLMKNAQNKRIFSNKKDYQDIENFIYNNLIQHDNVVKISDFNKVILNINSGFCALFVDKIPKCFCVETKKLKGRSITQPITEYVIRGSQEAFVENIRTNTGLLRKIVNNENLIIETSRVGKLSKTEVAICYMKNITNDVLVAEVKRRINNLKLDYILSSGQLEQIIKDTPETSYPQTIATERPDRVANYILGGRVAIIVNGSPFALVVPAIFLDFISTAEDKNINYVFANFLKFVRCIALFFSIFLPGIYVAVTNFHQELIPSELLFAIANAREAIPFPVIFEILLMEISFELIREAGLRVASSFSTTIGIIGALILGDAAVSANIVSPILIIVIAFTGICGFTIPDYSLTSSIRVFRFMYTILGFLAGFLGIAFGFFIHFIYLSSLSSFGVPYFSPYVPYESLTKNNGLFIKPLWKTEKRNNFLNTKRPDSEEKISMKWKF